MHLRTLLLVLYIQSTTPLLIIGRKPLHSTACRAISYQSDETRYGRGEMHLAADIDEGDVVVYQTGTWLVDGVEVGDGDPPAYAYALVDNIQVVFTHNCEHGFIRGRALEIDNARKLTLAENDIEFGPEQLVARFNVDWDTDEDTDYCRTSFDLQNSLWER